MPLELGIFGPYTKAHTTISTVLVLHYFLGILTVQNAISNMTLNSHYINIIWLINTDRYKIALGNHIMEGIVKFVYNVV